MTFVCSATCRLTLLVLTEIDNHWMDYSEIEIQIFKIFEDIFNHSTF